MKIVRNSSLVLLSVITLFACAKNPFLLNEELYSLEEKTNPLAVNKTAEKHDEDLSIFNQQEKHSYRKALASDSSSIDENENKISANTQTLEQISPELKIAARELMGNGSVPKINKTSTSSQPQVVNEKGVIQNADEIVQLDYEQIEIRQILEDLADALGMSIVIDPSISGKITMRTSPNQPLRNKDLWSVLNMLLNESGISLEKKAGLYYAKKSPLNLPLDIGYPSLITESNASIALQVTPLKNISATTALTVLKPIVGPKSKITQIAQLNMLAIIGSSEQLSRINGLIKLIDADPFKHLGIRLYKIKQADAKSIATELESILKLIDGEKSSYRVLGLDRINSLLVVAPPKRGFKAVDRWVKILDDGADESMQEQIFVYHCKSVKCETMAATLNSIFNQSSKKDSKVKDEKSNSNKANVFRTVPKDSLSISSKNKKSNKKSVKKKPVTSKKVNKEKNSADIDVTIVADADTNSIIVRTTGKDYRNLLETIQLLDQTPLQVLVNVVIAQVSLTKGQTLGLNWQYNNPITADSVSNTIINSSSTGLAISNVSKHFITSLTALASSGDANILSRPSLLIANNQEGVINVGKEVPVQTSSTTNLDAAVIGGNQVTQEIAYRNTGIELTVKPHINEEGVVTMEIKQSLSAIEGSTSSASEAFKPTFTNQDISTTVVVGDGETIVLGGLIDTVTAYEDSGVPFFKDLPVLGYIFKTQGESEQRRELMLIITPTIIGPDTDLKGFGKEFLKSFKSVGWYIENELSKKY